MSNPEYENQSGWITIKVRITTDKQPLNPHDEILLPWLRNGADISAQWLDGKTFKGLFKRSLNGIHVPLKELMPVAKTTSEVIKESFQLSVRHLYFMLAYLLLLFILIWTFPSSKVFNYLLAMVFGQMTAMVFVDIYWIEGFDLLFSDILILLCVLIISYANLYRKKFHSFGVLLFLLGIIHALGFVHDIKELELQNFQGVQSLFIFNLTTGLALILCAILVLAFVKIIRKTNIIRKWFPIIIGSMSVFMMLLIFQDRVKTGKLQILKFPESEAAIAYKAPSQSPGLSSKPIQKGPGMMLTPIMLYLSVEPFEVRQEILVQASAAMQYFDFNPEDKSHIPVHAQQKIKEQMQEKILSGTSCIINNKKEQPSEIIDNFVTLGRGGVSIRENPVDEKLDDAIMGITLIYDTENFPDSISIDWQLFTGSDTLIEASAVDPHGAFSIMLSPANNKIHWKSRLSGYSVPAIEPIEADPSPMPLASYGIWIIIVAAILYMLFKEKRLRIKNWMLILIAIAFIAYPFIRLQLNIPFIPQGKPSSEKGTAIVSDLLTNVYRAFDRRIEEDVYDRLAMSVSQDQLAEIYMQNRQAMAMENRGGARANVDEVIINELYSIKRDKDKGYVADVQWTVRGSVNHFGHTHYRQNQYQAYVYFSSEEGIWKIDDIDILDTKRLY